MSTILMSDANHFGINYVINPWMENQLGQSQEQLAHEQWHSLKATIAQFSSVALVDSVENLPDLVFTANAGTVKKDICVLSHFRHPERQGEEPVFQAWFEARGYRVITMPNDVYFEGAGDALFSHDDTLLWMGHGFRTDSHAAPLLADALSTEVRPLQLTDSRFYHLDTCFCPLDKGHLLYFPTAFDDAGNALIESHFTAEQRIAVSEEDACHFACNAVCLSSPENRDYSHTIVLNDCSSELESALNTAGYAVIRTPMSEFLKSGGATKCLTLKLSL